MRKVLDVGHGVEVEVKEVGFKALGRDGVVHESGV